MGNAHKKESKNNSWDEQGQTNVMQRPYPQIFGRYLLLKPITDGGMASISLARHLGGLEGDKTSGHDLHLADKLMAIKTIKLDWSRDESFQQMFKDEIRIIFGLNHPNIVQSYDYGFQQDQLYLAMEYIEGYNLREYQVKLKKIKKWFSVDTIAYITKNICQGLNHAHKYKNRLTGESFEIVHRDISPDNIMITNDGMIKIIDFGVAKAINNLNRTNTGMVKGKSSYMAPEYLLDQKGLTHLSDQFATGLILWELLTGRKCFNHHEDMKNLTDIMECKIPNPKEINPKVPDELAQIALKSLSKDPSNRFEDMQEMADELSIFLSKHYPDFKESKIKKYAQHLFSDEISEHTNTLVELGRINISVFKQKMQENKEVHTRKTGVTSFLEEEDQDAYEHDLTNEHIIKARHDIEENYHFKVVVPEKDQDEKTPVNPGEKFKKIAGRIARAPKNIYLEKDVTGQEKSGKFESAESDFEENDFSEADGVQREKSYVFLIKLSLKVVAVLMLGAVIIASIYFYFVGDISEIYNQTINRERSETDLYDQMYEENLQRRGEELERQRQERMRELFSPEN